MLPLKKDIKLVKQLHQKKFRSETNLFLVEGLKMVEEALNSSFTLQSAYTTDKNYAEKHRQVALVSQMEMQMMSALNTPSSHIAVLQIPKKITSAPHGKVILVLDGISDPGNMGTLLRTADWYGISHIYCSDDCVEQFNPKVVQSTMGSIFRIQVIYNSAAQIVSVLKQNHYEMIGADMDGTSIHTFSLPNKVALVIGSESHGIRKEIQAALDGRVHIPKVGNGESLNASVAAAIILSHWCK